MDRTAVLDLIAQQQRSGFADVAGSEGQASIRVTERLLNEVIATELRRSSAVREVYVRPLSGDRFAVRLVLAKPSFLPPINIDVLIERQPVLPDSPVLVLKLAGIGGLTRFVGPAAAFLNVLPAGIRMTGDLVHVDLAALLQQHGLEFVLPHIQEARLTTEEGAVRAGFRAGLR